MLSELELALVQLNHPLINKSFAHAGGVAIAPAAFERYFFECGSSAERLNALHNLLFLFVNAKVS